MKVCICDGSEERRLALETIIRTYFEEKEAACDILLFQNAQTLLLSKEIAQMDLFIIDSELSDTKGISVIRELIELYRNKVFILTGETYEDLDEAMDLGVARYILHSAAKEQYYSAMDKVVEDINHFIVPIKGRNGNLYCVLRNEIVFAEARARKTIVLTVSGQIETNMSISKIKQLLVTPNFVTPHYSFVVNSDYISHIEGRDILVKVNYHYFRIPIASKRLSVTKKQLVIV